jgi:hypothetical protein
MLRKSLILGSITLLLVMLFALTGCEGPVGPAGSAGNDGKSAEDGKPGPDYIPTGPYPSGPSVRDIDLEVAFTYGNIVVLRTSVETVYGKVPEGKTLYVLGSDTMIAPNRVLTVNGTLDILEPTAVLTASGIQGLTGALAVGEGAVIQGSGVITLPYVFEGASYTAGLHYKSAEIAETVVRYPGSSFDGTTDAPIQLTSANVLKIFQKEAVTSLTVQNVIDLGASAIPSGSHLTLMGKSNTTGTTPSNIIIRDYRTLTLASGGGLELVGLNTELLTGADGTIINNGQITAPLLGQKVYAGNSIFINNGEIQSVTSTPADIMELMKLDGTGKITLNSSLSPSVIFTSSPLLKQNLVIAPSDGGSYTLTLDNVAKPLGGVSPNKTITLEEDAILVLPSTPEGVGAPVINNGIIRTATSSTAVLASLFSETGNKGVIVSTANTLLPIESRFEIPEGIDLSLSDTGSSILASSGGPFDIIVGGNLHLNSGTLSPGKNVTVTGSLILLNNSSLSVTHGDLDISGNLNLGTSGGISVTGGGVLSLPSMGVVGDGGSIIAGSEVRIDGIRDYMIDNQIIVNSSSLSFEKMVENIRVAAAALKTVELDTAYNSLQGVSEFIGWASPQFPNMPERIVTKASVSTPTVIPEEYIGIPAGTNVYSAVGGLYDLGFRVAAATSLSNSYQANQFSLSVVDTPNGRNLYLMDSGLSAGATLVGVQFNAVRFVDSDLIGPPVPPFWVAVRTGRL